MRVLFVSSGNSKFGISPIIKNQGESLKANGIYIDYFLIKGKGLYGYLRNVPKLKKVCSKDYDLVHAHYSLTAMVAALACKKKKVVSLMGSDVNSSTFYTKLIWVFHKFFWDRVIVKSLDMKQKTAIPCADIIPNGVDLSRFKPIPKEIAQKKVNWNPSKKHILFAASPKKRVKNYILAKQAFAFIENDKTELHYLDHVPNEKIPFYLNATDVVLLTSLWEGSPNVIKEAMACNIPIVSTDVGDVKEHISEVDGCFISTFNPEDVAEKLNKAIRFGKRTNGRDKIKHLDSTLIAQRIIGIYKDVLINKR